MIRLLLTRQRELTRSVHGLLVRKLRANASGPRILANSIPKAGTHLLTRCLALLPGITDSGLRMRRKIGDDELELLLRKVGGGCFLPAHLVYSDMRVQLLADLGFQMALIIRDPRDVVVSHFHYVTYGSRRHRLHAYYASLPDDGTRLMTSITGILEPQSDPTARLPDIGRRFHAYLTWAKHGACVVKFKDLVGPHGGGSYEAQRKAIHALAELFSIELNEKEIQHVAMNVFYTRSSTFRKGSTGDWENHLTREHKEAFKEVAGQLLIDLGYECDEGW